MEKLTPKTLLSNPIYKSVWVNLFVNKVEFPGNHIIEQFHLLDFQFPAVTAVVENQKNEILLVKICRYPTGLTSWELPAGDIKRDETIVEAAKREILEETGYLSINHELLYSFYPMIGMANKIYHIIYCQATSQPRQADPEEVSEMKWFAKSEVMQMVEKQTILDGLSLTAILFAFRHGMK